MKTPPVLLFLPLLLTSRVMASVAASHMLNPASCVAYSTPRTFSAIAPFRAGGLAAAFDLLPRATNEGRVGRSILFPRYNNDIARATTVAAAHWAIALHDMGLGPTFIGTIIDSSGVPGISIESTSGTRFSSLGAPPRAPAAGIARHLIKIERALTELGIIADGIEFDVSSNGSVMIVESSEFRASSVARAAAYNPIIFGPFFEKLGFFGPNP